ncbi:sensor histidine kinase [Pedobacter duraquae]|uniref:histidine kinase n=1 Tax=Pedobacter duraquae TaxID=425511 RepID=A0A4R6IM94_9SPHI|nr:histidine kinase N-terminal 7TM domain-containing protein [Pedobacter duraquae]TDO23065.1 signal transduction histidine kinase [Pedobacter duraquae]
MEFTFNTYALILIVCGALTLFLSYYVYKKEGGAVRWFGLMMLSNGIWSVAYGFELASSTLDQMKFFTNIEYLGIATLPINWFFFCVELSGQSKWIKSNRNIALFLIVPVITILLEWTNKYHHLHYKALHLSLESDFPMVAIEPGISYRIFTAYFYILLAIGGYLLLVKFRKADAIYKKQNYSILIAALIPWIANISYLLGFRPLGNLDVTPFAFITTILLIFLGIYRFKLFDILPVAREKVLELMQDGFMVLDKHNRVIDYNIAFKKYTGDLKSNEIIGREISEIFPGETFLIKSITENRSGKSELVLQTATGTFDIEADIRYLNENKLNNEATIVKFQDLTNLRHEARKIKEQADELQELNQLKDRIFSIIAHDLRGPLVNLSEVLKMIANDVISIDEFKDILPTLSKDILYTTDLLENILHWSRSQLKGYGINKEYFDLKGMIINEIDYHLPSAKAKDITIIQDVFPGQGVYADMLMIQIVVRNILNNAIKFCNPGSTIEVYATYSRDGHMVLCIKDNGIGMSPEFLANLFDGKSVSSRGTMNEKGTGLGMVVCREFMLRNDGDISATSTLGKGTTFYISIPIEEKILADV